MRKSTAPKSEPRRAAVTAPRAQRAEVADLSRAMQRMGKRRAPLCKLVGPSGEAVVVPTAVFQVLGHLVDAMARGEAVRIVSVDRELTTQQAADILRVSRQYLVRLLDEARIPHRKTGTHRRLRIEDVLAFKTERDASRRAGLRRLSQLTQEFGGYDAELET